MTSRPRSSAQQGNLLDLPTLSRHTESVPDFVDPCPLAGVLKLSSWSGAGEGWRRRSWRRCARGADACLPGRTPRAPGYSMLRTDADADADAVGRQQGIGQPLGQRVLPDQRVGHQGTDHGVPTAHSSVFPRSASSPVTWRGCTSGPLSHAGGPPGPRRGTAGAGCGGRPPGSSRTTAGRRRMPPAPGEPSRRGHYGEAGNPSPGR